MTYEETKLSVIIVNYNVKYFLEQCLYSVRAAVTGMDAEVFVVDNNSTDGAVEYLRPKFPEVVFIENKDNPGFAKANNQAIRQCTGEYVLLLNPDTVVGEESLRSLCFQMDEDPEIGAIGVKMLNGHGVFLPESKRAFPSPCSARYSAFQSCFLTLRHSHVIACRIWIKSRRIRWRCWRVRSCCFAMRRWIRLACWMSRSSCMGRISICLIGSCWEAIRTCTCRNGSCIIRGRVRSMGT